MPAAVPALGDPPPELLLGLGAQLTGECPLLRQSQSVSCRVSLVNFSNEVKLKNDKNTTIRTHNFGKRCSK
jgi:hypothetical protein